MKLLLIRCGICHNWYLPRAHHYHCPVCASMVMMIAGKRVHVDSATARPITSGIWYWQSIRHLVNISQTK